MIKLHDTKFRMQKRKKSKKWWKTHHLRQFQIRCEKVVESAL